MAKCTLQSSLCIKTQKHVLGLLIVALIGLQRHLMFVKETISPSLFATFINDLSADIDCLKQGIYVNGRHISILFYADDIVIIANSIENLQFMLNEVNV